MDDEETELLEKADKIREKQALRKNESSLRKKALNNRAIVPRTKTRKRMSQLEKHLQSIGLDHSSLSARARSGMLVDRALGNVPLSGEDVVMRDADEAPVNGKSVRGMTGLKDQDAINKVKKIQRSKQMARNRDGRAGEADRRFASKKAPKHMLVGKRKMGKTNRR